MNSLICLPYKVPQTFPGFSGFIVNYREQSDATDNVAEKSFAVLCSFIQANIFFPSVFTVMDSKLDFSGISRSQNALLLSFLF